MNHVVGTPSLSAPDEGTPALMPTELQQEFAQRGHAVKVRKGQIIIAQGTLSQDVFLVSSGELRVFLYSSQGREVILRDLGTGHLVGEVAAIDEQPRSCSVVALSDAQVVRLSGAEFIALLSEVPAVGLWLMRQMSDRIRDLTERSFDLVTLPVGSRVQRELLRMAGEQHPKNTADTCLLSPMPTHADIAARVGTHREAVTREMGLLVEDGIIRKRGRSVEIISINALQILLERMRK
jgi:CRP/FNR family transcriptional regulator, cyclic AMP receptor protein